MTEQVSESPSYQGVAVFSYGFRPFFSAPRCLPVWRSLSGLWCLPELVTRPFSIRREIGMCMRWSLGFSPQ